MYAKKWGHVCYKHKVMYAFMTFVYAKLVDSCMLSIHDHFGLPMDFLSFDLKLRLCFHSALLNVFFVVFVVHARM